MKTVLPASRLPRAAREATVGLPWLDERSGARSSAGSEGRTKTDFGRAHILAGIVAVSIGATCDVPVTKPLEEPPPPAVASVSVSPDLATFQVGEAMLFIATAIDVTGSVTRAFPFIWRTDNSATAGFLNSSENGTVAGTGLSAGSATLSVTVGGKSASAKLTINEAPVTGNLVAVSSGGQHTCGISGSGAAYCWGTNRGRGLGLLGISSGSIWSTRPVPVSGGLAFAAVSAGSSHTCGVTTTGQVYCWGDNWDGQLGNGMIGGSSPVPVLISGGLTFGSVSAGSFGTCGLTADGIAYCWGLLGSAESVPTALPGGLTFAAVSGGFGYFCGITTTGDAYCWGQNLSGELGNGTVGGFSPVPLPVSGGLTFETVSAGKEAATTCGVVVGGSGYCWGDNRYGQLGNGMIGGSSPVPAPLSGGLRFATLTVGTFATCGVATSGAAYCWGGNGTINDAVLGNGEIGQHATPFPVAGRLTFISMSMNDQHACGISANTGAYCWGYNEVGQLGTGEGQPGISFQPRRVVGQ